MKTLVVGFASLSILVGTALTNGAEAKKCKDGQEFNPETGKCEVVEGS